MSATTLRAASIADLQEALGGQSYARKKDILIPNCLRSVVWVRIGSKVSGKKQKGGIAFQTAVLCLMCMHSSASAELVFHRAACPHLYTDRYAN